MNSSLVSHFKLYKVKLVSQIVPCDGSETITDETKKFIKSKKFLTNIKKLIYSGSAFDLNIAFINIRLIWHSFVRNKLTCRITIAVNQSLDSASILRHLTWAFGTFSNTGEFNGSFNFKDNRFCFTNETVQVKDVNKLCGVKIFKNSRILF